MLDRVLRLKFIRLEASSLRHMCRDAAQPQQADFKTFLRVSYCHTSMLTPDTVFTQQGAWSLLDSTIYYLVASCDNIKGGLSLSVK